jgi:pimeloyl-ACP methyl ester carboxylesterase
METIYKTPEGRAAVLALYDRELARLELGVESRFVDTRFGRTHLLVAGPQDAPPLVIVHGANGSALPMAQTMGRLAAQQRCVFVDVPGEPNRSSETRLLKSEDSLGQWMEDVLDALGYERVAMLGMSGGGYAVLKSCARIPERLSRVVLMVPEGFARAPVLRFLGSVMWPLVRYRLSPTSANVRRVLAAMAAMPGSEIPDSAVAWMSLVMSHVKSMVNLGPLFSAEDLAGLRAPVLLVVAGRDVVFPGDRVAERARRVIPNLRDVIVLPEAGHSHPELVSDAVMSRIASFLAEDVHG